MMRFPGLGSILGSVGLLLAGGAAARERRKPSIPYG